MESTFTEADRERIITAVAASAPADATDQDVAQSVRRVVRALANGSPSRRVFEELDRQAEKTESIGHVDGVVIGYGVEQMSNGMERGVVFLRTEVHEKHAPEGKEHFRSEPLGEKGSAARDYMREFATLVGHKVVIEKHLEKMKNGNKVRVVRGNIRDMGVSPDYDPSHIDWQPVYANPSDTVKNLLSRTRIAQVRTAE